MKKRKLESLNDIPAVASYLRRIGAEPTSFNHAAIINRDGKYEKRIVNIKFFKDGSVTVLPPHFAEANLPTEEELNSFSEAFESIDFPEIVKQAVIDKPPPGISLKDRNIFIVQDINGQVEMLLQRIEVGDRPKFYKPWTFWSDGVWREQNPEVLPLYGMPQMKNHGAIVFLHEGPKGARRMLEILSMRNKKDKEALADHPWANDLAHGAHIGWLGGAFAHERVDWASLRRAGVERLYIISDNDKEGRQAVPHIAQYFDLPTVHVQFDDRFEDGFDLGDEFPATLFVGPERTYIGPSFLETLQPATWATTQTMTEDNKPVFTIRDSFAAQWSWVEQNELFVNVEFPTIQLKRDQFNNAMLPFSHVRDTAALLLKRYTGRKTTLTYRPDIPQKTIITEGETAINLFRPTFIEPMEGSVKPFLDFLAYLFPNKEECLQIQRWIATLTGRLDVRIAYGLLVISENQGVGKTTLGNLLAELVGKHNCSFPSESMIVQQNFNGWIANKRLIHSPEIYSGHSWQAYHRLKSYITDEYIEINIKHQKTYTIPNHAHFYVCSNSLTALKIEDQDRRWYMPKVVEIPWNLKQFQDFRLWLAAGGVRKILHWAQTRPDEFYISPGDVAPMTASKGYIIEESRSDAQALARKLGEIMMRTDKPPIVMQLSWVRDWCGEALNSKIFDNERSLGRQMKIVGVTVLDQPVKIGGVTMRLASNRKELLNGHLEPETLKKSFVHPRDLYTTEI